MQLPFKAQNKVTSAYGERLLNGNKQFHAGLDIVGIDNKTVHSVCAGTVAASTIVTIKTNRTWEWGNYIRIDDKHGNMYFYCHLQSRNVIAGQKVEQGEAIGIMGNTGYSLGAHLHLQMRDKFGTERCVPEVLGIKNECGIYTNESIGTKDKQEDLFGNADGLAFAIVGPISKGDFEIVSALAKELGVACAQKLP